MNWNIDNFAECDVNCHKKCERLTANLCGVNQKLIVEALASVKRGNRFAKFSIKLNKFESTIK